MKSRWIEYTEHVLSLWVIEYIQIILLKKLRKIDHINP